MNQYTSFEARIIYTSLAIAIGAGFLIGAHLALPMGFGWNLPQHFSVWIQVHGHLQLAGWVSLFMVGVSLYFIPRFLKTSLPSPLIPQWVLLLIGGGLFARSLAEFVIAYTRPSFPAEVALALLPAAAFLEWTGFMLFIGAIVFMHAKSEGATDHFKTVKPFFLMMLLGFFVYATLQFVQVLFFDVTERLPWNQFSIRLFMAFALLPMPVAFATRTLPLFLRIPSVRTSFYRFGVGYFLATVLMLLPEVPGISGIESAPLLDVSNVAQVVRSVLVIWMMREMKLYQKMLMPSEKFLRRYFGQERSEGWKGVPLLMRGRTGYFDAGQFGRFELLIYSAVCWLTVYALFELANGVAALWHLNPMFGPDSIRHSFFLGFITLLIMGMAVRMLPGFVQKNGVAYPHHVLWLAVLGNLAALLRVAPIAVQGTGLASDEELFGVLMNGFGLSGLVALLALILFSVNIVKTLRHGKDRVIGFEKEKPELALLPSESSTLIRPEKHLHLS